MLDEGSDVELEESVRTISALFSQTAGGSHIAPRSAERSGSDEPLERRVASISAEIAAAIAQASSHALDGEDDVGEEDEDGERWTADSGTEIGMAEGIVPKTSGIRGEAGKDVDFMDDDDEDSDTFPIPLRTRKGKDPASIVGMKRKR